MDWLCINIWGAMMAQDTKRKGELSQAPENASFVLEAETPKEKVEPGIRRQFLGFNNQLMAVRVWFDKGAIGQLHAHPHTQVSYVESGRFKVTVGAEEKMLKAGDSFFVSPETQHGAVCLEEGVLIDMFSPMREDFLQRGDMT